MGWGTGVYYNPERLGLEPVGEVDFSDGCYQGVLVPVAVRGLHVARRPDWGDTTPDR